MKSLLLGLLLVSSTSFANETLLGKELSRLNNGDEVVSIFVGGRDYTGHMRLRSPLLVVAAILAMPTLIGTPLLLEEAEASMDHPRFNNRKHNRVVKRTKRACEEALRDLIEDNPRLVESDYYCSEVVIFETNQRKPEKSYKERSSRGPRQVVRVGYRQFEKDYHIYSSAIMKRN
jgi:hypothetical protein